VASGLVAFTKEQGRLTPDQATKVLSTKNKEGKHQLKISDVFNKFFIYQVK
jgi:hypothetical protein